jgi:hypothetical protein
LQRDGELVSEAGVVRTRIKRRQRRDHGNRGKLEVTLTVLSLREFLHHPSGCAHRAPAHTVFTRYHQAGIQYLGIRQNLGQEAGLSVAVIGVEHGRADRCVELFLRRDGVVVPEKCQRLFGGQTFGVFRKWLGGNANPLHFKAARLENRSRVFEHLHRVRDLRLILRAVEIDERSDRANLGLLGGWCSFLLGTCDPAQGNQQCEHRRGDAAAGAV